MGVEKAPQSLPRSEGRYFWILCLSPREEARSLASSPRAGGAEGTQTLRPGPGSARLSEPQHGRAPGGAPAALPDGRPGRGLPSAKPPAQHPVRLDPFPALPAAFPAGQELTDPASTSPFYGATFSRPTRTGRCEWQRARTPVCPDLIPPHGVLGTCQHGQERAAAHQSCTRPVVWVPMALLSTTAMWCPEDTEAEGRGFSPGLSLTTDLLLEAC